ncbi:MAG: SRPBCC family protein [Candidatus Hodarchaeales archaeon]
MPRELRTEIMINASAEKVWNQLMDFESYPDWNPYVKAISGDQEEGAKLEVDLQPNGGRGMIIKPKITEIQPNERFAWKGKFFVPRLFDGEHIFEIESISEDQVRFIHREEFRGANETNFEKCRRKHLSRIRRDEPGAESASRKCQLEAQLDVYEGNFTPHLNRGMLP